MEFQELISRAKAVVGHRELSETADAGEVAAAILSGNGNVYVGVCMNVTCSIGFCAEHTAASAMVTAGESHIVKVVAIDEEGNILAPCGRCREMMNQLDDRNSEALVMVAPDKVLKLSELLPYDWRKTW